MWKVNRTVLGFTFKDKRRKNKVLPSAWSIVVPFTEMQNVIANVVWDEVDI